MLELHLDLRGDEPTRQLDCDGIVGEAAVLADAPLHASRWPVKAAEVSTLEPKLGENSLIQEIDGEYADAPVEDDVNEDYFTRPYGPFTGRFLWLAAGVIVGAIGLGFLGILLWAQFQ